MTDLVICGSLYQVCKIISIFARRVAIGWETENVQRHEDSVRHTENEYCADSFDDLGRLFSFCAS